jgi:acetyl esterase
MTRPFVRPDVRAYLDQMKVQPRPPMNDETIAMMRKIPPELMAQMLTALDRPVGELGTDQTLEMPGPGGSIQLRLFDPRAERAAGPVVVFYHGGGFVVGSIGTHAPLAAEIARGLDLPVISVEYRLAPEHKWPAAPDDAEAATRWIAENAAAFGREFTHLILCGDSAGGNLTIATALALRDRPAPLPLLMQIPLYPRTDASIETDSLKAFGSEEFGLNATDMAYFEKAYAASPTDPRHSVTLADQTGLPPTLIVTAALDPLRDEGRAYAAKAIQAGVNVTYREFPGTIHGFCTFRQAIPSAHDDLAAILSLAKAMVAEALA